MTDAQGGAGEGERAFRRAAALLDGLSAAGLAHAVISPGSRSTALALAAARCDALRVHVIPDERSAGFFALGLARASGCPAALIGTSGSAPAHWLAAAIEAGEDCQPMLLLSADRPPELLGCGANQATEQRRVFAAHARAVFELPPDATPAHALDIGRRAAAHCRGPRPGPVHINAAFREPLVPSDPARCGRWSPGATRLHLPGRLTPNLEALAGAAAQLGGRRGALLAGRLPPGDPAAPAVLALARALGCAVVADPLSGLRAGTDPEARVLCRADAFMRAGDTPVPDWLIRVGAPAVSHAVEQWAARCPEVLLLAAGPDWADPLRAARTVLLGEPAASLTVLTAAVARARLQAADWTALDELEARAEQALGALPAKPAEAALVEALASGLPAGTPLFVANSLVVRDFDSFLGRRAAPLAVYANRGASGIDGNVSTAAGLIEGAGQPGVAVIGDLALFHDLNGLALCRGRPLVVVVVNNGGGAIFGQLAQAALPEFESLWLTPPGIECEKAAALFELDYLRLDPAAGLAGTVSAALAAARPALLELVVDRQASHAARQSWWQALRQGP